MKFFLLSFFCHILLKNNFPVSTHATLTFSIKQTFLKKYYYLMARFFSSFKIILHTGHIEVAHLLHPQEKNRWKIIFMPNRKREYIITSRLQIQLNGLHLIPFFPPCCCVFLSASIKALLTTKRILGPSLAIFVQASEWPPKSNSGPSTCLQQHDRESYSAIQRVNPHWLQFITYKVLGLV